MKTLFSQQTFEDTGEMSLLKDIEKTRCALEIAYLGFDNATEPDLIDSYIFEVNAILKRYKYLLELASKMNLAPSANLHEEAPAPALIGQVFS